VKGVIHVTEGQLLHGAISCNNRGVLVAGDRESDTALLLVIASEKDTWDKRIGEFTILSYHIIERWHLPEECPDV
jgi:hypothetical protein